MNAAASPLPDNAACPRCGGPFRCGASDPTCACFDLKLTEDMRRRLSAQYAGCLCVTCLLELQRELPGAPPR